MKHKLQNLQKPSSPNNEGTHLANAFYTTVTIYYIHVFVQIILDSAFLICMCDGQVHKSTDTSTAQLYAKHNPTATTGKNRNNIRALVVADFAFHVEDRVI